MSKFLENIQPAVKEETKRLAIATFSGVAVMYVVFFILHLVKPEWVPFDYTVILGGLVGGIIAVLNFFLMGLTVQKIVATKEEDSAKSMMKASYTQRTLLQMLWVVLAIVLPVFQMVAGILPLFFPGIWFKILGIIQK